MSLYVVSTPIGHEQDISQRALDAIKNAEIVIGEERKPTTTLLKKYKLTGRPIELLNEHSDQQDLEYLLGVCKNKTVALISDCGTPGFCDPGADLVQMCRSHSIDVVPVPGASSLMALLSVCGFRLDQFLFRGFLPANNEKRQQAWKQLKSVQWPSVIMDTPYRLEKTLSELNEHFPKTQCVIGFKITQDEEQVLQGVASELQQQFKGKKGEFILLIARGV